jgi:hypothetical protein
MIITETTLTGTEEELLEYFTKKYNLVEKEVKEVASILNKFEQTSANLDPHQNIKLPNTPVQVSHKPTTGIGNLFGGTSWGQ